MQASRILPIDLFRNAAFYEREAIMPHWRKTVINSPETAQAAYVAGWMISSLAVLGVIVTVWVFGV
jgi:hypothetical protein